MKLVCEAFIYFTIESIKNSIFSQVALVYNILAYKFVTAPSEYILNFKSANPSSFNISRNANTNYSNLDDDDEGSSSEITLSVDESPSDGSSTDTTSPRKDVPDQSMEEHSELLPMPDQIPDAAPSIPPAKEYDVDQLYNAGDQANVSSAYPNYGMYGNSECV